MMIIGLVATENLLKSDILVWCTIQSHNEEKSFMVSYIFDFYIHYDPLMMQQKEARRKHSWVLPKKVAFLV